MKQSSACNIFHPKKKKSKKEKELVNIWKILMMVTKKQTPCQTQLSYYKINTSDAKSLIR